MDGIPFAATQQDQVVPVHRFAAAAAPAQSSRAAWNASLATDVLVAAGSGGQVAAMADVFLRLRFCPTAVVPGDGEEGGPLQSPFGAPAPFSSSSSSSAADGGMPQLVLGASPAGASGSPAAEVQAAAGDGGDEGPEGPGGCDAPIALPRGASAAQCAAARRLLRCSESLLFLTELKDARLAPANVSAAVEPTVAASSDGGGGGGGGADGSLAGRPAFTVVLSSDAVALFVSPEVEQAGRFNASGLLLLPWAPQAVGFHPIGGEPSDGGGSSDSSGWPPQGEPAGPPGVSLYWLQQALNTLEPPAPASSAAAARLCCGPLAALLMASVALLCTRI